jgi:hypothetical protein
MRTDREAIIDGQSEQYRRGQILGFTMAEIMLVLLFLLLLVLGSRVKELAHRLETYISPDGSQREALRVIENTVNDLKNSGLMEPEQDELWLARKLTLVADRVVKEQGNWSDAVDEIIDTLTTDLDEERKKNQELTDTLERLRDDDSERVAATEMFAAARDSQLSFEEAKACLKSCGSGPDACWGESLRSPDYIYNVAIYDNFVKVEPDHISVEKNFESWRSLPKEARIDSSEILSISEFRSRFGELLSHSRENQCVFQVRLFDADTSSKSIYKDRRRLVEGYVYPTPVNSWPGASKVSESED